MTVTSNVMTTVLYQAKGGQGCTTIAAGMALAIARETGDQVDLSTHDVAAAAAVMGIGLDDAERVKVTCEVTITTPAAARTDAWIVHDLGIVTDEDAMPEGRRLLVTRGCYLALSAAVRRGIRPDGIVLLAEEGRSLNDRDVSDVIGAPVLLTVPVSPHIARAIDAGLLPARLPREFARLAALAMAEVVR